MGAGAVRILHAGREVAVFSSLGVGEGADVAGYGSAVAYAFVAVL